jgi:HSP20 family protein
MTMPKEKKSKTQSLVPISNTPSPFWQGQRLLQEMDRLLKDRFNSWLFSNEPFVQDRMPAINIYEEKNNFVVETELPGMKINEIEIYMLGNTLNIIGKRQSEHEEKTSDMYQADQYSGQFHHQIPIPVPVNANKISALSKDGILTITCPKIKGTRRKQIQIKVD